MDPYSRAPRSPRSKMHPRQGTDSMSLPYSADDNKSTSNDQVGMSVVLVMLCQSCAVYPRDLRILEKLFPHFKFSMTYYVDNNYFPIYSLILFDP